MDNRSGDQLRQARVNLGASKADLAREAGMNRSVVESVEKGHARPENVTKYKDALMRLQRKNTSKPSTEFGSDAIEIEVTGNFGIRISARGSVENVERIQETVSHLLVTMNQHQVGQPQSA